MKLVVPTNCTGELILPKGTRLESTLERKVSFGAGVYEFSIVTEPLYSEQ